MATVEQLYDRLDRRVVEYLSDDLELGVANSAVLASALDAASTYIDAMLPAQFKTNTRLIDELVLTKAMANLYRRFGFFTEAATLEAQIRDDINRMQASLEASAKPVLDSRARVYREEPLFTAEEIREAFENGSGYERTP